MISSTRGGAKITYSDQIVFKDVPILSPNGDVLIEKMSFEIFMQLFIAYKLYYFSFLVDPLWIEETSFSVKREKTKESLYVL
mgnify:CR=1 FL=1